jgi:hypothetical protein
MRILGGAAVATLATSAGCEINRLNGRLKDDYKNERISRQEYGAQALDRERLHCLLAKR